MQSPQNGVGSVIVKEGTTPTFQSLNYGSILDITLVTENLRSKISQWEVSERESLSDHNYIMFDVRMINGKTLHPARKGRGWQVRKLDRNKLNISVENLDEHVTTPKHFAAKVIADKCMPRKKYKTCKQPVYWWNDEISELRKECHQETSCIHQTHFKTPQLMLLKACGMKPVAKKG